MSRAGDLRNITATGTASEDNYVLTYDDATKKVSLEAASSGNTFSSDITAKTSVNTSSYYYRGAILNLQTDHTTVQVQDTLGAINFSAPDESSGGYASQTAGSITVKPEANFTSSSNRSEMVFALGSAVNGIRDVMSLSTVNGRAAVQGLAPSFEIQNNDTSSQGYEHVIGTLAWNVTGATAGGTQLGVCAEIEAIAANGFSTTDNDTDLIFKTSNSGNPVERFRITHDGHIKVKGDILHDGELDIKADNGDVDIDSVGGNVKLAGDTGNMTFTNTGTGVFTFGGTIQGASNAEIKTSPIRIHSNTISTNTTVASTENAVSGGPVTIANGVTVTVSGDWTVV
tara:strand:+ start:6408 stop:7433 length:1026 start_codon:yes stop_codon:yes gene_type:complete